MEKNLLQILNESKNLFENEEMNDDLFEDTLFEDSDSAAPKEMSEEDLKIESLKIATNIAKLMSDVTPEDIIQIASKVSDFIKNHEISSSDSNEKKEEKSEDDDFDINSELK